eukprot:3534089-Prymnesium_polylepis.1
MHQRHVVASFGDHFVKPPTRSAVQGCCPQTVRIGMPAVSLPPMLTYEPSSGLWGGYMTRVISSILLIMGTDYEFVADDTMETAWETGGSEVSPHLVSPAPTIDMQLVGIHVEGAWLPDSIQVARTVPIYTSYYAGLQYRERLGANRFRLFDPFSYDMWLAICATAVATALIMSLLSSIETA